METVVADRLGWRLGGRRKEAAGKNIKYSIWSLTDFWTQTRTRRQLVEKTLEYS